MALKKSNINFIILAVIIIAGTLFLLFNEFGVIRYMKLKSEVEEIKANVRGIEEENRALKDEIDSLEQKVPAKIEKTAREKYQMVRPGEKTIKIKEE